MARGKRECGTSSDVLRALSKRCEAPAWSLLFEVGDKTGFGQSRRADAIAMSTWPSRGLHLHGFEVKASRGDWRRELEQPEKSAAIQRYCDFWWVAAAGDGIVELAELPPTWGLLVLQGERLVERKAAPMLAPVVPSRGFLASLFRSMTTGLVPAGRVDEIVAERLELRVAAAERSNQYEIDRLRERNKELEAQWAGVTAITGANIAYEISSRYGSSSQARARIATALRYLVDGGVAGEVEKIERARGQVQGILDRLDEVLAVYRL